MISKRFTLNIFEPINKIKQFQTYIYIVLFYFISFLLNSKATGSRAYFYASFIAYFLGLVTTVVILHVFKSAQPALLYLVPACVGSALLCALVRGEIQELFK